MSINDFILKVVHEENFWIWFLLPGRDGHFFLTNTIFREKGCRPEKTNNMDISEKRKITVFFLKLTKQKQKRIIQNRLNKL